MHVAWSHAIFRAGEVQQDFGDSSLTIRERYALAGARATSLKFPSQLLSPFCLLQMP